MADIRMHLDEKTQIIHQRIEGIVDIENSLQMFAMVAGFKAKLRDPGKIRILVVSETMGKPTSETRKLFMENLKKEDLYRMAFMGNNPYMKAVVFFFNLLIGTKKIRLFSKEEDAVAWLTE